MYLHTISKIPQDDITDEQIATTYTIAKDEEFTEIIVSEKVEKPLDIYSFFYPSMLEPHINHYIKITRHFIDSVYDYDEPVKVIRDDKHRSEALIFKRDNIIEKPWIFVNTTQLNDTNAAYFNISTSPFKATMSGHDYTHWIITDSNNHVVFKSLEDSEHLTSIDIFKSEEIITKTSITVYVIFGSSVAIESEVAMQTINLQSFNFEVASKVVDVTPGEDYDLTLRRLNVNKPMNIARIEVVEPDTMKVLYTIENTDESTSLTFKLPWYLFNFGSLVKIVVTAIDAFTNVGHNVIVLRTSTSGLKEIEDTSYKYKNKAELVSKVTDSVYTDGVYSVELPDGYIPMPVVNKSQLYKYEWKDGKLVNTGKVLDGISLLSVVNDNTFIKYTENNILVVDCFRDTANGTRTPVFLFYRHNTASDTYNLISMINHPLNDTRTAAYNNSLTQLTATTFLYMSPVLDKLYTLDIIKGTCEELTALPSSQANADYKWFMRMPKQRVYIQHGNEHMTYKYEIKKNRFEDSFTITPPTFTDTKSVARNLPNGDNLIFKREFYPEDSGPSILVYDYKNNKLENVYLKFEPEHYPTGSILLLNNDVLLLSRNTELATNISTYVIYRYF